MEKRLVYLIFFIAFLFLSCLHTKSGRGWRGAVPSHVPLSSPLASFEATLKTPLEASLEAPLEVSLEAPLQVPLQAPLKLPLQAPLKPPFKLPFKPSTLRPPPPAPPSSSRSLLRLPQEGGSQARVFSMAWIMIARLIRFGVSVAGRSQSRCL